MMQQKECLLEEVFDSTQFRCPTGFPCKATSMSLLIRRDFAWPRMALHRFACSLRDRPFFYGISRRGSSHRPTPLDEWRGKRLRCPSIPNRSPSFEALPLDLSATQQELAPLDPSPKLFPFSPSHCAIRAWSTSPTVRQDAWASKRNPQRRRWSSSSSPASCARPDPQVPAGRFPHVVRGTSSCGCSRVERCREESGHVEWLGWLW